MRKSPRPTTDYFPYLAGEDKHEVAAQEVIMLFVNIGRPLPGDVRPVIARRAQWDYPEGLKLIAEYWLQHGDMTVLSIFEADNIAPILATNAEWSDAFSWTTVPAITAEDGIALFKSMPH